MLKVFKCYFAVLSVLILTGCTNSLKTESALLEWLNEPENGYVKRHHANGFSMTLKYLPAEYLAYKESKEDPSLLEWNDLLGEFKDSRTFLLSIEHELAGVDVTNYGVRDMPAYKKRISQLNFNIKDYLFLKDGSGQKSKPALTTFENLYEIGGKKVFYIVFSKEQNDYTPPEHLDIVFEDPFLETGISHFVFKTDDIDNLPPLQFIN